LSQKILLIGGTSSGKTHFGAQVLARLQAGAGALRFRQGDAPVNISLFENTLQRLGQGLSSDHTGSGVYGEVVLPAVNKVGAFIDLVWPDYAGEQVEDIAAHRGLTSQWIERIAESDDWILMVRPMFADTQEDQLNRPLHNSDLPVATAEKPAHVFSKQSHLVELLQILRHIKGVDNLKRARVPRMLVLLSCWDELGVEKAGPEALLSQRLPMLHAFLQANWADEALFVYGLSSLGKSLSPTRVDAEYQDRGPESFGYVVLPSGALEHDLTAPLAEMAK
jgi:hypothetical protein